MSLYNHVANKGDLVGGIVDRIVGEFELPAPATGRARSAGVRSPPTRCSCATVGVQPRALAGREPRHRHRAHALHRVAARAAPQAGFSPEQAYHGYHALDSHILGFTIWQLGHSVGTEDADLADLAAGFLRDTSTDEFPYLIEHVHQHLAAGRDGASEFEYGLDLDPRGIEED